MLKISFRLHGFIYMLTQIKSEGYRVSLLWNALNAEVLPGTLAAAWNSSAPLGEDVATMMFCIIVFCECSNVLSRCDI